MTRTYRSFTTPWPSSVVRIKSSAEDNGHEGTGVVFLVHNDYAYVMTARHVVCGDKGIGSDTALIDGRKAVVVASGGNDIDIAILKTSEKSKELEPLPLASRQPHKGDDNLSALLFDQAEIIDLDVEAYAAGCNCQAKSLTVKVKERVGAHGFFPSHSGSPLLDAGRLCGILVDRSANADDARMNDGRATDAKAILIDCVLDFWDKCPYAVAESLYAWRRTEIGRACPRPDLEADPDNSGSRLVIVLEADVYGEGVRYDVYAIAHGDGGKPSRLTGSEDNVPVTGYSHGRSPWARLVSEVVETFASGEQPMERVDIVASTRLLTHDFYSDVKSSGLDIAVHPLDLLECVHLDDEQWIQRKGIWCKGYDTAVLKETLRARPAFVWMDAQEPPKAFEEMRFDELRRCVGDLRRAGRSIILVLNDIEFMNGLRSVTAAAPQWEGAGDE